MGWFSNFFSAGPHHRSEAEDSEPVGAPADDADYWYEPVGAGKNAAGIKVTADSSLKCAAVFRAVTVLTDTMSTIDWPVYKLRQPGNVKGGMDLAPDHPLHDVLTLTPNAWQTPAEFWGMMIFHAALRGIAYAEIIPGVRGAVQELVPIHPDRVQKVEQLPDRTLRLTIQDPRTNATRVLLQDDILRIPGLTSDGVSGLRTVELAAEAIGLLMAADRYAARVFSNNLNMGGFFKHPGKLSKPAITRLRSKLMGLFSGERNFHRPAILQEGMEWVTTSMRAKDAQLLEARRAQIGEIGRYWGVPLHMMLIDDQTNRSTVEEMSLNFIRFTIRPWAEKIQQAIRRDLITAPRYYVVKVDLDELESGNMQARADFFAKMLGSGGSPQVLTVNEVRQEEGWNRSDDPSADRLAPGSASGQKQEQQSAPADAANDNKAALDAVLQGLEHTADRIQGKLEAGLQDLRADVGAIAAATDDRQTDFQMLGDTIAAQSKIVNALQRSHERANTEQGQAVDEIKHAVELLQAGVTGAISRVTAVESKAASRDEAQVVLGAEAMVRKEVAALRRLAMRHADDPTTFRKAVAAFYGGFASDVIAKLGVTRDQAREWCKRREARVAGSNDVLATLDQFEDEIDAAAPADG